MKFYIRDILMNVNFLWLYPSRYLHDVTNGLLRLHDAVVLKIERPTRVGTSIRNSLELTYAQQHIQGVQYR